MFPPARGHPVVTGFLFLSRIACERGHPLATGFLFSSVRASILVRASGAHWLPCFPALHRTGFQVCLASSSMTRTTIHAVAFMRASTCEWLPLLSCRSSARGHPIVKEIVVLYLITLVSCVAPFQMCDLDEFSFSVCCAGLHLCVASSCLVQVMCAEASSSHWLPGSSALQHTGFQVSLASGCMT